MGKYIFHICVTYQQKTIFDFQSKPSAVMHFFKYLGTLQFFVRSTFILIVWSVSEISLCYISMHFFQNILYHSYSNLGFRKQLNPKKLFTKLVKSPFGKSVLNPFQHSVAFHIETSHLFCTTNQMNSFYMICNSGLKWLTSIQEI